MFESCDDGVAVDRLVALGAHAAATPADAASRAGNAITCLPSPAVSEAVLAGPGGLLEGLPTSGVWIEMSTNGRDEIVRLAAARGACTLECSNARMLGVMLGRPKSSSYWSTRLAPTCAHPAFPPRSMPDFPQR